MKKPSFSEFEFRELCNEHAGFCVRCREVTTFGVEPDAYGYECEGCEKETVIGLENALLEGRISVIMNPEERTELW